MPRPVNKLVKALAKGIKPPGDPRQQIAANSPEALARGSGIPEIVMFIGFLGGTVTDPDGKEWQVLYLDLALSECILIEDDGGIVAYDTVLDDSVPFDHERDVLWVKADTPVGRAAASQSTEGQFLTGDFTRAGDFEAPLAGGTLAAATGVFCEARTPSCCRIRSRPY